MKRHQSDDKKRDEGGGIGLQSIRQGIRLEVSPKIFNRVQLRRVGRKEDAAHMRMLG